MNRYSYTFNNPLKFTDPTGNEPEDVEKPKDEAKQQVRIAANKNANSPNGDSSGKGNRTNGSSGINGLGTPDGRNTGSGGYNGGPSLNDLGNYGKDVGKYWYGELQGFGDVAKGTINAVAHPIDTAGGIISAAGNAIADPKGTAGAVAGSIAQGAAAFAGDDMQASGRITGQVLGTAAVTAAGGKAVGKATDAIGKAIRGSKGLTTPNKFFSGKSAAKVESALEAKYGSPRVNPAGKSYYNPKSGRSYYLHEQPGHSGGQPHIDIRTRGSVPDRGPYILKK